MSFRLFLLMLGLLVKTLSCLPGLVVKIELDSNPIPRSFIVKPLSDFVGSGDEERLSCPVGALRCFMYFTASLLNRSRSLFVLPRNNTMSLSKNALLFFFSESIKQSGAVKEGLGVNLRVHDIKSIATSIYFLHNYIDLQGLKVAAWRSRSVLVAYSLKDVQITYANSKSLGPLVVAGDAIQ